MATTRFAVCSAILSATFTLTASAQERGKGDPWERMSSHDKNGDGKVTKEEFGGPEQVFTRYDADEDGAITKEEVAAARKSRSSDGGRGRVDNAPKVGDALPEVKAQKQGSEEFVDLSEITKTTVLVFGSHT